MSKDKPDTTASKHGTITWLIEDQAAAQFASDTADLTLPKKLSTSPRKLVPLGAAVSIAGLALAGGQMAMGVASHMSGEPDKSQSLVLEIVNLSGWTVVPTKVHVSSINLAKTGEPMMAGTASAFTFHQSKANTNTTIGLDLSIIDPANSESSIPAKATFSYHDQGTPGRWRIELEIDGKSKSFNDGLVLSGASFSSDDKVSFSMYSAPIETYSGEMTLTLCSK